MHRRRDFLGLQPHRLLIMALVGILCVVGLMEMQDPPPVFADGPTITDVTIISSPDSGDTYWVGEEILIAAIFSTDVEVDGSPALGLRVGTDSRSAEYLRGSGSDTLVFGYTVTLGDTDSNGVRMPGGYRDDNGNWQNFTGHTAVTAEGTSTVAERSYDGFDDDSDHKVDGRPYTKTISITSTPQSTSHTYGRDEVMQVSVNFGTAVDVGEDAIAIIRIGSWQQGHAAYVSGSGTDTIVFEYTVEELDLDENGVDAFVPLGQDIKAAGTDIEYVPNPGGVIPSMGEDPDHKVDATLLEYDTTAPSITSVVLDESSAPGPGSSYEAGDPVGVLVTFDETVNVTWFPELELRIGDSDAGDTERYARFYTMRASNRGREITMQFSYIVQDGDIDDDGISIGEDSISLTAGTIKDDAGNDAILTHDALSDDPEHTVYAPDVTAPSIVSVEITSDAGTDDTYDVGDEIEVTVFFSEDVTVTGTPQIGLDMGGEPRSATYDETDGDEVIFTYTVDVGDFASDGIGIRSNALKLGGGTIRDGAGHDATLTHNDVSRDSEHKVSAAGGL